MADYELSNICKDYADVWFEKERVYGYVHTEEFVTKTDFEKDEIYTVDRWVPFVEEYGCHRIGRLTGYRTRQEALAYLSRYVKGEE